MFKLKLFIIYFSFISFILCNYNGKTFSGQLESKINEVSCVRIFYNNGSIGCRTKSNNNKGILYEIRNSNDINNIKNIKIKFSIVMSSKFFTKDIIKLLLQNQPEGVIIYDGSWEPDENSNELYSTDINTTQGIGTPQSDYSFSRRYNWNNYGNGIMYESLPFPVVRASDDEIGFLQRLCSENRDYGIYSNRVNVGEFRFYMGHDSITSNECLAWTDTYGNRRPQCLPIGGSSIWSSADTLNNKPKVIITTGIDSTAFFHDLAYGGNDAVASIATLLIAIEALGRYQDLSNLQYQPLFFFANAEEWGYAGSRRFVRDITEGISCEFNVSESNSPTGLPFCTSPIYPTTLFEQIGQAGIREILAIDQVGKLKNGQLFLHSLASNPDTFNTIITSSSNIEGVTVTASTSTSRIPPTPMSSFLNSIPSLKSNGVVITGYDTNFNDPLFHTRFDTADKIVVNDIILSAQVVLQSVLGISGGDVSLAPNVNETLASEIIDCLSTNWHCSLIQKYVSFEKKNLGEYLGGDVYFDSGTTPPNYYTGVLEASTGGLPVIQHSHYVYGDYPEKWDLKHDRVYSIPNYLESFIRTFSSYHLTPIQSRNNNNNNFESSEDYEVECKTSLDCNNCTILSYSNVKMECILNECICPLSYYHLALDPGIKSDLQANYFSIIDKSAVSYTEPYWSHIGVKVYPDVGNGLPMTTFAIGIVICFLSIIGAIGANFYMGKIKAL